MKLILRYLADNTNPDSLAVRMRRKRFQIFIDMVETTEKILKRPLRILDVGGTEIFWEVIGYLPSQHHITLLNLTDTKIKHPNIVSVVGDARNMYQFSDGQFDIVISNSVIEHLGSYADQLKMAQEIRRVSPRYFVQTPSFFFPLEPHFLFPFFHWLPRSIRIWLVNHFSLGWYQKATDIQQAAKMVDEIRLMKRSELRELFPDASIFTERFFGLVKSYIVVKL